MMPRILLCAVLVLPFSALPTVAQSPAEAGSKAQQEKKDENIPAKPAVLSGAALRFGADLQGAATPAVLKWAKSFAKKEILKAQEAPGRDTVAAALSTAYAGRSEPSRKAGEVLVWYLAYLEGTKNQETAAQRVRDMERELDRLQDDQQQLDRTPVEFSQMPLKRAAESRILGRIEEVRLQRDIYKRVLDGINARVDICLENLAALTDAAKGMDPVAIRGLK